MVFTAEERECILHALREWSPDWRGDWLGAQIAEKLGAPEQQVEITSTFLLMREGQESQHIAQEQITAPLDLRGREFFAEIRFADLANARARAPGLSAHGDRLRLIVGVH